MGAGGEEPAALTLDERTLLLRLARRTVEDAVRGDRPSFGPEVRPTSARGGNGRTGGAFVSLHRHDGALRGCVGLLRSESPLERTVALMAAAAATRDGRFPPVAASELRDLRLEISVLGPLRLVRPEEVLPGRHGLHIRLGPCSGVLLPQVAVENGWSRERFLSQTAGKAGLPEDAWQRPEAEILVFMAEVFAEP